VVSAGRHPKKEIADALRRAEQAGLKIHEIHRGHRWGEVTCERCRAEGADASRDVWSTPRNAGNHAKQIDRFTRSHLHT
jgi:hypothetical protein